MDGSNTKTTMQQTVHQTQQPLFGPRRSNHLLRRFAAGPSSSASSIWRRASSMFGAMVRALVKECLHRCEVKAAASCSASSTTSIIILGRSPAALVATKKESITNNASQAQNRLNKSDSSTRGWYMNQKTWRSFATPRALIKNKLLAYAVYTRLLASGVLALRFTRPERPER